MIQTNNIRNSFTVIYISYINAYIYDISKISFFLFSYTIWLIHFKSLSICLSVYVCIHLKDLVLYRILLILLISVVLPLKRQVSRIFILEIMKFDIFHLKQVQVFSQQAAGPLKQDKHLRKSLKIFEIFFFHIISI